MKRTFCYILCIISIFCASCKKNSNTVTLTSDTDITSFTFAAVDSFPSASSTVFTISNYGARDTGLITNPDSMAYRTPVTRLVPRLQFKSTPSSTTLIRPDGQTYALTGRDTIDFSQPVLLRIISSDQTATKFYRVVVNVHQVDPDLMAWKQLNPAVLPSGSAATKGAILGNRFILFANDGFKTTVYQSADGSSWDTGTEVSTLPANCHVRDILAVNSDEPKLYYCREGKVYSSADGVTWQVEDLSGETYVPRVMLMHFNDSVWLVAEHSTAHTYHLSVRDGDSWRARPDSLPANWPLTDFTTVTFRSESLRPRAMIIGGYDIQGNSLSSLWNIEYTLADGYRKANFAIQHPPFSAVVGASAVWYGKRCYLFGGVDAEAKYLSTTALYSDDEGLNWHAIDTVHNRLMDVYQQRTQTTAITHDNCIYLFGGQTRTETFSDVLRGKLTSIDW